MEADVVYGLEQVVEGAELERRYRVVVEGCHEDHGRHLVCTDLGDDIEPVQFRHLDVEENEIGLVRADSSDGLQSVLTLSHDLNIGYACQKCAQTLAGQRLIVDYENAKHSVDHDCSTAVRSALIRAPFRPEDKRPNRKGIVMRTAYPPSSRGPL